jgi:hypothetical protein
MLETHIMISSLIFRLVLILVFYLVLTLVFHLALLLVLCLSSLMDLTIAHIILIHEITSLCLDASYTHFEPRHLDGPCFPCRGSRPTRPNGDVKRNVKTSSNRMVKCWIPKIYLTNPSTELSTSSRPM